MLDSVNEGERAWISGRGHAEPFIPASLLSTACFVQPLSQDRGVSFRWTSTGYGFFAAAFAFSSACSLAVQGGVTLFIRA
jgi:hypothetical protein